MSDQQFIAAELTSADMETPELAQTLCTALQVGIVEVLRIWNIRPSAVVGHSSGEIAAAYAAGAITAEDAIKIAYFRGQVSRTLKTEGGLAAVGLSRYSCGLSRGWRYNPMRKQPRKRDDLWRQASGGQGAGTHLRSPARSSLSSPPGHNGISLSWVSPGIHTYTGLLVADDK